MCRLHNSRLTLRLDARQTLATRFHRHQTGTPSSVQPANMSSRPSSHDSTCPISRATSSTNSSTRRLRGATNSICIEGAFWRCRIHSCAPNGQRRGTRAMLTVLPQQRPVFPTENAPPDSQECVLCRRVDTSGCRVSAAELYAAVSVSPRGADLLPTRCRRLLSVPICLAGARITTEQILGDLGVTPSWRQNKTAHQQTRVKALDVKHASTSAGDWLMWASSAFALLVAVLYWNLGLGLKE